MTVYHAGPLKRHRATKEEMAERANFLIAYAKTHSPVTVRQLFYAATVANLPGIEKTEAGYCKVQAQVLNLRRSGKMPYHVIADATRFMRKPRTYDGWQSALVATAQAYRKSLWVDTEEVVEVWLEKNALAGVISPVTNEYDVPLMATAGFTSETFAFEAVDDLRGQNKRLVIYSLYDFDRSGQSAEQSLREKVYRFGAGFDVDIEFHSLALNVHQVENWGLPARPHKRATTADKAWPHSYAAELDAIPPDQLRDLVRGAIEHHISAHELEALKQVEKLERKTLEDFIYQ
ncbi:hypothetical protein [Roseovarius aestuarii]|uniref:Uncharacterized protein n=1 Tax=Roseovarius aestuarii TaxID=475083 RepID=A0A1X7BXE4_9RHOB|nr:hypothetical protein [Roseovarius aestuarii]SMC14317.1 hypothetical protein ROA7745_04183 [Roseovarius aestuarii]